MVKIGKGEVEERGVVERRLPGGRVFRVDLEAGIVEVVREGVREGVAFKEVYFTTLTPEGEFVDDEGVRWRVE